MSKKKDFKKDLKAILRRHKELLKLIADLESANKRLAAINSDMREAIVEREKANDNARKQIETNKAAVETNRASLKEAEAELADLDKAIDEIAGDL